MADFLLCATCEKALRKTSRPDSDKVQMQKQPHRPAALTHRTSRENTRGQQRSWSLSLICNSNSNFIFIAHFITCKLNVLNKTCVGLQCPKAKKTKQNKSTAPFKTMAWVNKKVLSLVLNMCTAVIDLRSANTMFQRPGPQ